MPERRTREVVNAELRVARAERQVATDSGDVDVRELASLRIDQLLEELQSLSSPRGA